MMHPKYVINDKTYFTLDETIVFCLFVFCFVLFFVLFCFVLFCCCCCFVCLFGFFLNKDTICTITISNCNQNYTGFFFFFLSVPAYFYV